MYNSESSSSSQLHPWQQWAFRIEQRLQEQQDMIDTLQATIIELKQQLLEQEQQQSSTTPPIFHVEKIEYHFDQLKVDTLEGSLQIGLSTASSSQLPMMIEELAMKQNAPHPNAPSSFSIMKDKAANTPNKTSAPLKSPKSNNSAPTESNSPAKGISNLPVGFEQHLYEQMRTYLQQQGTTYIRKISSHLQIPIHDEHISQMLVDLEQQLDARIHHYTAEEASTLNKRIQASDQELQYEWEKIEKSVRERTWHDIETAITQYLQQQLHR